MKRTHFIIASSFMCLTLITSLQSELCAQSITYNQYWNNVNFAHPFKDKWAGEINLSSTFTSPADHKNLFFYFSQYNFGGCIHHYYSSRWKFSAYGAVYLNTAIMDIQPKSNEFRLTPQGTYYFHKRDYTLTTTLRLEARYINQEKSGFKDYYRYRQQLRYLKPFNSKIILEGIWYGIASDEVFFKLNSDPDQSITFDRNRLSLGVGYSLTNNMQIELVYANEYLPRSVNEIYNAISVSFNFNNFIDNFNENLNAVLLRDTKPDEE